MQRAVIDDNVEKGKYFTLQIILEDDKKLDLIQISSKKIQTDRKTKTEKEKRELKMNKP